MNFLTEVILTIGLVVCASTLTGGIVCWLKKLGDAKIEEKRTDNKIRIMKNQEENKVEK